jgi:hypothetical protein
MLSTTAGILAAVALLLPGFLVAEISRSGRARGQETDLELILRSLFFALLIQVVFAWWTRLLVDKTDGLRTWSDHLAAVVLYSGVVLLLVPILSGIGLNLYLRNRDRSGEGLRIWHRILGGRDHRDAWDYLIPQLDQTGAWLIVELEPSPGGSPRLLGGKYGDRSAVGQSPSPHDLYLQEIWTVSATFPPSLVEPLEPQRGIWLPAASIRSIQILDPPTSAVQSSHG